MKRSLVAFVTLGLLTGLIGCGGSSSGSDKGSSRDELIRDAFIGEFVNNDLFEANGTQAGCYFDFLLDETGLSPEEIREGIDSDPEIEEIVIVGLSRCSIELKDSDSSPTKRAFIDGLREDYPSLTYEAGACYYDFMMDELGLEDSQMAAALRSDDPEVNSAMLLSLLECGMPPQ